MVDRFCSGALEPFGGYFPQAYPNQPTGLYWMAGLLAAVLFSLSVIVHELSHSFTAIRSGIKIPEITLFIFRSIVRLSEEANDPKTELKIAIVGPLTSFALAGFLADPKWIERRSTVDPHWDLRLSGVDQRRVGRV